MSGVPTIPENAPFSPEQRAWLNGFFAGIFSQRVAPRDSTTQAPPAVPLTILYGTQTGTAEGLARKAAKEAGRRGFVPTILDMAETDVAKLAGESNLLVITSTYGDGEPPDNARELHDALAAADGPVLSGVQFSVCSLGDSNYSLFCQCGKDFDTRLERLGARRVANRVDCDVDLEEPFGKWLDTALSALSAANGSGRDPGPAATATDRLEPENPSMADQEYSRKNPYFASVNEVRRLSAQGSGKDVNHIVFSLGDSGISYEPGDALAVFPHNDPTLVDEILQALGCDGEEAVQTPDGIEVPLRRALAEHYDLGPINKKLENLLNPVQAGGTAIEPSAPPSATNLHVIDALLACESLPKAAEFVASLRKLQPRLYSIASSLRAHPGEVHLTVAGVRYEALGRQRVGVCSTFLSDRVVPGQSSVGVFVHHNRAFKLPPSGDTPIIMVGPGTGIAPFRAFLEERRAAGARGRNWLFFGDRSAATDFIYRDELQSMQSEGLLTRLDLAWSRDQKNKIYVQDRMLEAADELYSWLNDGAFFYVCGDASRMARDVDAALHRIIETAGGVSAEEAAARVKDLKAQKRYARDVY